MNRTVARQESTFNTQLDRFEKTLDERLVERLKPLREEITRIQSTFDAVVKFCQISLAVLTLTVAVLGLTMQTSTSGSNALLQLPASVQSAAQYGLLAAAAVLVVMSLVRLKLHWFPSPSAKGAP